MELAKGNMQTHHSVLQKAMEEGSNRVGQRATANHEREKVQLKSITHKSLQPFPPCQRGEKEQRKSSQKTLAL